MTDPPVSDEVAAHYRDILLAHADDWALGVCPLCRTTRCANWRWAFERLLDCGRLAG